MTMTARLMLALGLSMLQLVYTGISVSPSAVLILMRSGAITFTGRRCGAFSSAATDVYSGQPAGQHHRTHGSAQQPRNRTFGPAWARQQSSHSNLQNRVIYFAKNAAISVGSRVGRPLARSSGHHRVTALASCFPSSTRIISVCRAKRRPRAVPVHVRARTASPKTAAAA